MSYAIGNIIYGIPLDLDEEDLPEDHILREAVDGEYDGFLSYYSGSGDIPAAFGVEIDSFDECCFSIDISSLRLAPTDAQLRQYERLLEHVDQEVKAELEKFGEPRTFILWSTS
jgi:hypothetical protein